MSVEQGYDPRDFSLVAFGGAGPLHANAIGKLIRSFPVVIPPSPGVLCALGDVATTLRHEVTKAFIGQLCDIEVLKVTDAYQGLLQQATREIEQQGLGEKQRVRLFFQGHHSHSFFNQPYLVIFGPIL